MFAYPLSDEDSIVNSERDWAFAHGLCVNILEHGKASTVVPVAHTLLPSVRRAFPPFFVDWAYHNTPLCC